MSIETYIQYKNRMSNDHPTIKLPEIGTGNPLRTFGRNGEIHGYCVVCDWCEGVNFVGGTRLRKARRIFWSWGWTIEGYEGEESCLCSTCKPRITFAEARKLGREIYNDLMLRKEQARKAEARYWDFLYEYEE